jgi:hypothetical protein
VGVHANDERPEEFVLFVELLDHALLEAIHALLEPIHPQFHGIHSLLEAIHAQLDAVHSHFEPAHTLLERVHTLADAIDASIQSESLRRGQRENAERERAEDADHRPRLRLHRRSIGGGCDTRFASSLQLSNGILDGPKHGAIADCRLCQFDVTRDVAVLFEERYVLS